MAMVRIQQLREEVEEVTALLKLKLPQKLPALFIIVSSVLAVFLVGLCLGLSTSPSPCSGPSCSTPVHYFISQQPGSCPRLEGEGLLTTVEEGHSFEGYTAMLQCQEGFPFPLSVKCQRKQEFTGSSLLEWSGLPVCHPSSLVTTQHWKNAVYARSVTCLGSVKHTECRLQCVHDHVAVEEQIYNCTDTPCRTWSLEGKACFQCDKKCQDLGALRSPSKALLLDSLGCDPDCHQMLVLSRGPAAIWQSKRTGIFSLVGEHRGRPLYQGKATKEFLYYSETGTEWLVGPNFRTSNGGIQVFYNDDKQCPERFGGSNLTRVFVDPSQAGKGLEQGVWQRDDSIELQCYRKGTSARVSCHCDTYQLSLDPGPSRKSANGQPDLKSRKPRMVDYMLGNYSRVAEQDSLDILAPLYRMEKRGLYLFSHHPEGLVWQVSPTLTTSPLRGLANNTACPDNKYLAWEWYSSTSPEGAPLYVKEDRVRVTCITKDIHPS